MTEKIRPKNRILNYTAVIVGIILCVSLGVVVTHADSLDKVVLLEDRNPGYWKYLSPDRAHTYLIGDNIANNQEGDGNENFVILDQFTLPETISCTVDNNGVITLNGDYQGSVRSVIISDETMKLLYGYYCFSSFNRKLPKGIIRRCR